MKCQDSAWRLLAELLLRTERLHPYDKERLARAVLFLKEFEALHSEAFFKAMDVLDTPEGRRFRRAFLGLREVL